MPLYNMDIGDDYNQSFEAVDDEHAMIEARHAAQLHGATVELYRGPIISGTVPFYTVEGPNI